MVITQSAVRSNVFSLGAIAELNSAPKNPSAYVHTHTSFFAGSDRHISFQAEDSIYKYGYLANGIAVFIPPLQLS